MYQICNRSNILFEVEKRDPRSGLIINYGISQLGGGEPQQQDVAVSSWLDFARADYENEGVFVYVSLFSLLAGIFIISIT